MPPTHSSSLLQLREKERESDEGGFVRVLIDSDAAPISRDLAECLLDLVSEFLGAKLAFNSKLSKSIKYPIISFNNSNSN